MSERAEAGPCDHVALYDDDCGFCRWSLDLLLARDHGRRVRPIPIQSAEGQQLLGPVPAERRLESWHLITPAGEILSAGQAVPVLLELLRGGSVPARVLRRTPRFTDRAYRAIASNRSRLSRILPVKRDVVPRPC